MTETFRSFAEAFDEADDAAEAALTEVEVPNLHPDVHVTAVLVAHDGAPWLPVALAAVRAQDRPVDALVVVDTGSLDATPDLLADAVDPASVLTLPRDTGFGEAVARGVRHAGDADWIWILHDDSAGRADALRRLLDTATARNGVGVVGPKVLGWADRTHLLEVGISTARGGRRETGLERDERDQGQHDQERDVLAVGSAGMLVRRAVWDELGGFDPDLPMFRDDLDFGWRANRAGHRVVVAPAAVVHHAEAATRRRRPADAVAGRPTRADRAHAMSVILANVAAWTLPFIVLRLVLGSLARTLGFAVGKDGAAARAELGALGDVLRHPGRLRRARASRRAFQGTSAREVERMLAPPGAQVRHALEVVGGVLTTSSSSDSGPSTVLEAGPSDDDFDDLDAAGPGIVGRALRRPSVLAALALVFIALIAERALIGRGRLLGGALLPAPDGTSDWWQMFTASWHPVSVGSAVPAPPTLPVLTLLGVPALGQAPAVVDLLILLAVPLAFISAYACLAGVTRSPWLRAWASLTYAVLPAVTGAIAAGRIGTIVLAILLPPLARALVHAAGYGRQEPGPRAAWGSALLLAVVAAFVPLVWALVLILAVLWVVRGKADSSGRVRAAIVVGTPLVLWLPWSWHLLTHPQLFLLEAGAPAPRLADPALPTWSILGLDPGGPGTPVWWFGIGVLLAALAALLRPARRGTVLLAWLVGGIALAVAFVLTLVTVTPPGSVEIAAWPGPATLVAGLALLVAAVVGNESSGRRLSATRFSWRQIAAASVTALAVLAPVLLSLGWVERGADGPIRRSDPQLLPAFVVAQSLGPDRPRTLVLRPEDNRVTYALLRDSGPVLGDAEVVPDSSAVGGLDEVVSDLASGRGGVEAARLSSYAVKFVQVDRPVPQRLADRLDAVPALTRVGAPGGGALWRVSTPSVRARLEPSGVGRAIPLTADEVTVTGTVPQKWNGGRIVLADQDDPGWRATAGGVALQPVVVDGWAQGFELPAGSSGAIVVGYQSGAHARWLILAGVALLATIVLALPARRRDEDEGQDA
jgi:GT2 family glycosyltransferase